MSVQVKVKYKYGKTNPTSTATFSGLVAGQSESAVMAALQKKHRDCQIIIVSIEWG